MRGIPHIHVAGACYFITTATDSRKAVFSDPANCRILTNIIYNMRLRGDFLLAGFVIMPDHLHLALLPTNSRVSKIMRDLKKGSARLLNIGRGLSGHVWQLGYWDRMTRDEDELKQKVCYMMNNPCRAGISDTADSYPWSSANPEFETDLEIILGG